MLKILTYFFKNHLTSDDLSLDNFIDNFNQISDYEFVVDQFKKFINPKNYQILIIIYKI